MLAAPTPVGLLRSPVHATTLFFQWEPGLRHVTLGFRLRSFVIKLSNRPEGPRLQSIARKCKRKPSSVKMQGKTSFVDGAHVLPELGSKAYQAEWFDFLRLVSEQLLCTRTRSFGVE